MKKISSLFENNRNWAKDIKKQHPGFFEELSKDQHPEYLWIGCSDSRVPANEIVGLAPGDLFVHRNVANLVVHSDVNCQAVIQYAVEALKVKHIIVCGHYGCGGVKASMQQQGLGLIDNWVLHIKDTYKHFRDEITAITNKDEQTDRLCELNVHVQVMNVCQTPFVQKAWKEGQELSVHGWIYNLKDGLLKDLGLRISSSNEMAATFKTD